jgi:hypothetical protein
MKNFLYRNAIVVLVVSLLSSACLSAQEIKKEMHIKIVENGVVTKDTVYNISGESPEIQNFMEMEEHHSQSGKVQKVEKRVITIDDNGNESSEIIREDGKQKEVKVIVHNVEGEGKNSDVEEIWINGQGDGKHCRTIIIHEGDCGRGNSEKENAVKEKDIHKEKGKNKH